jgi:hypothetical protein
MRDSFHVSPLFQVSLARLNLYSTQDHSTLSTMALAELPRLREPKERIANKKSFYNHFVKRRLCENAFPQLLSAKGLHTLLKK